MWPKCAYEENYIQSQGTGEYCCNGTLIIRCRNHATGEEWEAERGTCPVCNGTGEAVELTERQAAEYLRDAELSDYIPMYPFKVEWDSVKGEWIIFGGLIHKRVRGITFKAALNTAARVIKERKKGLEEDVFDVFVDMPPKSITIITAKILDVKEEEK